SPVARCRCRSIADGRDYTVLVNGRDVTWAIRSPEIEAEVSTVSAWPPVRKALVEQQRRIARRGSIVVVGRDIGTVVLPDADLKIFLTASPEERARRRADQLRARGGPVEEGAVLTDLTARDAQDSGRVHSPLQPAADAHLVDSTGLTIDQVIELILGLVRTVA
ncbi:MAG TPA: (d)CMP kinase, partial [Dehalococcoidia bacterium]|nr:(d)CMP kinase [Dehalococcoidia bacterium]